MYPESKRGGWGKFPQSFKVLGNSKSKTTSTFPSLVPHTRSFSARLAPRGSHVSLLPHGNFSVALGVASSM